MQAPVHVHSNTQKRESVAAPHLEDPNNCVCFADRYQGRPQGNGAGQKGAEHNRVLQGGSARDQGGAGVGGGGRRSSGGHTRLDVGHDRFTEDDKGSGRQDLAPVLTLTRYPIASHKARDARTVCTKWMMLDWEMMRLSWPVADTMGTRWTFGVDRATISSAWCVDKGSGGTTDIGSRSKECVGVGCAYGAVCGLWDMCARYVCDNRWGESRHPARCKEVA